MAFRFTDPRKSPYERGGLYLGEDDHGAVLGITSQKHAITFAPTGSGKGAALIIPNLRRWPHSAVVVDPKGENAVITWRDREAMGQKVVVLDPFREAEGIPERLRGSFNPLTKIDAHASGAREALQVIADGLVKSHDPKHMEWVEGARSIVAGVLAYVVETATPESKTFAAMREILLMSDEELHAEAQLMQQCTGAGRLAHAAGSDIITALESTKSMEKDFLGGAKRATKFLDSPEIAATLATSNFDLADLKRGDTTVFLVLPFDYIDTYSSYLRLFVRCALSAMGRTKGNGQCLFLLDEFFALGKINEIRSALAQMRSYGVKLWPFLQDLGQLQELYDRDGAFTFFANADAHIFLGNADGLTLDFISKAMDNNTFADLDAKPPVTTVAVAEWERVHAFAPLTPPHPVHFNARTPKGKAGAFLAQELINGLGRMEHEGNIAAQARARANLEARMESQRAREATERAEYEHTMRGLGRPRLSPQEIRELIGQKDGDVVARSMIVFGKGGDIFNVRPRPYFVVDQQRTERAELVRPEQRDLAVWFDYGRAHKLPPNTHKLREGSPQLAEWKRGYHFEWQRKEDIEAACAAQHAAADVARAMTATVRAGFWATPAFLLIALAVAATGGEAVGWTWAALIGGVLTGAAVIIGSAARRALDENVRPTYRPHQPRPVPSLPPADAGGAWDDPPAPDPVARAVVSPAIAYANAGLETRRIKALADPTSPPAKTGEAAIAFAKLVMEYRAAEAAQARRDTTH